MSVNKTIKEASYLAQTLLRQASESTETAITIEKLVEELQKSLEIIEALTTENDSLTSNIDSQSKEITKLTDDISSIEDEVVQLKTILKENDDSQMDTDEGNPNYPLRLWSNGMELYDTKPEIATALFFERRQLYEKINPEYFEGHVTKAERDIYIGRWVSECWKHLNDTERNKEFLDLNSAGMLSWEELNRLDRDASHNFLMKFDPEVAKQLRNTPN